MNRAVQQHIPEGYMKDAKGRLVPIDTIDEIDLTRNDLVSELTGKAKQLQQQMRDFKLAVLGDIGAFVDLAAERYEIALGGKKGNVTLISFDGRLKIQRAIQEHITFDERLQAAKALIDNCIHRWSEGSALELKVLVDDAFQVDKEGQINTGRVLSLRRHKIDDEDWRKAMDAIADSIQVTGSKTYVRFYERVGQSERWEPIPLDLAAI
ncbi:DUF3164 family protein [Pontibacterium granulatum]|uniref:DUF3164 family protein n=1 Tax=Pontibacterium granulatum TaxID=2036029 RepID=UPI002499E897|nr:DUF3164 family protein [Pontibacterium granulatum]MDI3325599.1 DUF3164 family protein [Pontibacterium granulatum]